MGADPVSIGVELAAIVLPKLGGLFSHRDTDLNRNQRRAFEQIGGTVQGHALGARRGHPLYFYGGEQITKKQAKALLRLPRGAVRPPAPVLRPGDVPFSNAGVYSSVDDWDQERYRQQKAREAMKNPRNQSVLDEILKRYGKTKAKPKRKRKPIRGKTAKATLATLIGNLILDVWSRYSTQNQPTTAPQQPPRPRKPAKTVISPEEGGYRYWPSVPRTGSRGGKVQGDVGAWTSSSSRPGPAGGVSRSTGNRSTSGPPRPKSISRSLPKPVVTPTKVEYKFPLPTSGPGASTGTSASTGVSLPSSRKPLPSWVVPVGSAALSAFLAPKPGKTRLQLMDPFQDTGGLTSFQDDVSQFAGYETADGSCNCGPKKRKRGKTACRNKTVRSKTYTRSGRRFKTITRELTCPASSRKKPQ